MSESLGLNEVVARRKIVRRQLAVLGGEEEVEETTLVLRVHVLLPKIKIGWAHI